MDRYQPFENPNDVPEGTIVRGRTGLYWISQNVNDVRQWELYDGRISSDSEYESSEPETNINTQDYRPPRNSFDIQHGTWSLEEPRQLRRSPATYDLTSSNSEDISAIRQGIYEERNLTDLTNDDNISYRSFSTSSMDDRNSVYSSDYEEDSEEYNDVKSESDSVINYKSNILDKCLNESPVTLVNYDDTDLNDLFIVHVQNQEGKFVKGSCLLRDEMREILKSDLTSFPPSYIMSIYKTPSSGRQDDLLTGLTGKPTGKIIVRLPTNQIYITFGSLKRVLATTNTQWYALPLYGGKLRRVGNVGGIYGASMNHGQVPGFKIYKLFTYDEIKNNIVVQETTDDFPHTYEHNTMLSLFDLIGETPLNIFINNIIDSLIHTKKRRERRYGNPID
jgi:hypothetical protein